MRQPTEADHEFLDADTVLPIGMRGTDPVDPADYLIEDWQPEPLDGYERAHAAAMLAERA